MHAGTEALLARLQALPAEELEFGLGGRQRIYRGPSLYSYAVAHGLLQARGRDGLASAYLVVRAEDGASAAVSMAEIAPQMTDHRMLLATEVDGEPLRMGVRLVVPREGGRSLQAVTGVEARDVAGEAPTPTEAASTLLDLRGDLQRPGAVDLAGWDREQQVEVETVAGTDHAGQPIPPRKYGGVPVHLLLSEAGMYFMADGDALLGKVIVATGADGRRAVLSAGEFGPRFNSNPAIVALRREGEALRDEGPLRLMVPYDQGPDRRVRALVSLEIRDA